MLPDGGLHPHIPDRLGGPGGAAAPARPAALRRKTEPGRNRFGSGRLFAREGENLLDNVMRLCHTVSMTMSCERRDRYDE